MSSTTPHLFQIGDWSADANQNLMWQGSQQVNLEPKAMAILQYLVVNANKVISRKELFDKFWKNQVVTEDALNRAMWNIRRALGDTPNNPKYIATIRNRGYKLVAPVTLLEDPRLEKHEKAIQDNIASSLEAHEQEAIPETIDSKRNTSSENLKVAVIEGTNAWKVLGVICLLVAIFALYMINDSDEQLTPGNQKLSRITYSQSQNIMSTTTVDGEQLVYIAKEEDGENKLIHLDRGKNKTYYLGEAGISYSFPIFHRDGRSVAVVATGVNEKALVTITLDENKQQKIVSLAQPSEGLSWHPHQSLLAYTQAHPSSGKTSIYTVHTELKVPQVITENDIGIKDSLPQFSPSGDKIAFIRHFSSLEQAIFTVDLAGKTQRLSADLSKILAYTWINEKEILLSLPKGFFILSSDGLLTAKPIHSIDNNNLDTVNLNYAAKMDKLFISQISHASQVVNYRLDKHGLSHNLTKSQANDINGAVSNNGLNLAFVSNRTGSQKISILQGHKLYHIDNSVADYIYNLRWSPDSKTLSAIAKTNENYTLLVYQTDKSHLEKYSFGKQATNLSDWQDNSTLLYTQRQGDKWQLFQYDVLSDEIKSLSDLNMYQARLTPDKRQIVFIDFAKAGVWLWDRNSAPSLLSNSLYPDSFSWFIDNEALYYLTPLATSNRTQLWQIDFDSKKRVKREAYPMLDLNSEPQKLIYGYSASEMWQLSGDIWQVDY